MRLPNLSETFILSSTLFALTAPMTAQLSWRSITSTMPTASHSFGMVTDTARQQIVLFGGDRFIASVQNETWVMSGTTWKKLNPATSPPARFGVAMAYDSRRSRVLLFGGFDSNPAALADTWEWNGTTWKQLNPTSSPPARGVCRMVYDTGRDRMVVFGGWDAQLNELNDTWEFDGTDWARVNTARAPTKRAYYGMAFDPNSNRTVLHGGDDGSSTLLGDMWSYDGANWTQLAGLTLPPSRFGHVMSWDPARSRVVLIGGSGGSSGARVQRDTWEWDGRQWLMRLSTNAMGAPHLCGMAFDPIRRRMVQYGASFPSLRGTFELVSAAPASVTSYGTGCRGTNGLPVIAAAPRSMPLIGGSFDLLITSLPTTAGPAWLAIGVNRDNFDLGVIGMPSCARLQTQDVIVPLAHSSGSAAISLPIPNSTALLGSTGHTQAITIDRGANALGATVTNGLEVKVGI